MGWLRKKKKPKSDIVSERGAKLLEDLIEFGHGQSNPIKFFSADEILKATNNFSHSNRVRELVYYYDWYSGKNENHPMILIKKDVCLYSLREDLLCRDIAVSSMVSGHKNFLKLVGCCRELEKPVLVYHGVKKHYKLDISEEAVMVYHGVKKHYRLKISEETWKRRMKIAEDIATAFAYLHTAFPRPFVYRNFSLDNIILDEDGVAKLTDFSYCVSIPEGETFVEVDSIVGTYGHMDAKYAMNGIVSEKTDVFAFGILLQKFLMGEKRFWNHDDDDEEDGEGDDDDDDSCDSATMWRMHKRFLFRLLKFKEEQRMDEIADPKMIEKMGQISEHELCQMNAFLMLSVRCMGYKVEVPTMVEVAKELKKIQTSLYNDSYSPSDETHFDSPQDISSSVVLSNQT